MCFGPSSATLFTMPTEISTTRDILRKCDAVSTSSFLNTCSRLQPAVRLLNGASCLGAVMIGSVETTAAGCEPNVDSAEGEDG